MAAPHLKVVPDVPGILVQAAPRPRVRIRAALLLQPVLAPVALKVGELPVELQVLQARPALEVAAAAVEARRQWRNSASS